jgi:methionyl-tRNA formyltransferase
MKEKKPIKLRIVFMGTSSFAEKMLSSLLEEKYNILAVFTQPDKKSGRKGELLSSPVKILAEKNKIPIIQPEKFDEKTISLLKETHPDLIVVAAYGKILPEQALEVPGFGSINVHASLLPKFRGASPIQNALLSGESETGITIMLMDKGMDTGNILSQEKVSISPDDTTQTLAKKLELTGTETLLKTIPLWIEKKISPIKQDDSKATMCQLIERNDGKIVWDNEAQEIYNQYRAFFPWPGVFSFWEDNNSTRRIKLTEISLQKTNPVAPHHLGEVFQIGEEIGVQTGSGVIILNQIQLEGKSPSSAKDFTNGHLNFIGSILK